MNDILDRPIELIDKHVSDLVEKYWEMGTRWQRKVREKILAYLIDENNDVVEHNLKTLKNTSYAELPFQKDFRWDEVLRCTVFNMALGASDDKYLHKDALHAYANRHPEPDRTYAVIMEKIAVLQKEKIQDDYELPTREQLKQHYTLRRQETCNAL